MTERYFRQTDTHTDTHKMSFFSSLKREREKERATTTREKFKETRAKKMESIETRLCVDGFECTKVDCTSADLLFLVLLKQTANDQ